MVTGEGRGWERGVVRGGVDPDDENFVGFK